MYRYGKCYQCCQWGGERDKEGGGKALAVSAAYAQV